MKIKIISPKHGEKIVTIDDEDFEKIKYYSWCVWKHPEKHVFYARCHDPKDHKKTIFMHKLIIDCPLSMVVDHIDGCGLNNAKKNLRICSTRENKLNSRIRKDNVVGLKGVRQNKSGTFTARIKTENERICLGTFTNREDAYEAYCKAVKMYHKEFGRIK